MSIGELAAQFGLGTHVLRHWEAEGLLTPRRQAGGRRRYEPADRVRVTTILLAKEAGLSLEQIRRLFADTGNLPARRALLREHHARLAARVASLQASMAVLEHALACAADDLATCPDFQAAVAAHTPG